MNVSNRRSVAPFIVLGDEVHRSAVVGRSLSIKCGLDRFEILVDIRASPGRARGTRTAGHVQRPVPRLALFRDVGIWVDLDVPLVVHRLTQHAHALRVAVKFQLGHGERVEHRHV